MIESLLRNSVSRPLCDRVSAQKLSESSVVSDRLVLLPGRVRGEKVLCVIQVYMYLTLCYCLLLLYSKSSGSEWLAMSELYSTNNYNFM